MRCISVILFTISICCVSFSNSIASNPLTAEETVQLYCKLDYEGVRLSGKIWSESKINDLYEWEHEPGWDIITAIKDYKITKVTKFDKKIEIVVHFNIFGDLSGSGWEDEVTPEKEKPEDKVFTLVQKNNEWKIVDPMYHPHVSINAIIPHIAGLIESDKKNNDIREGLIECYKRLQNLAKTQAIN